MNRSMWSDWTDEDEIRPSTSKTLLNKEAFRPDAASSTAWGTRFTLISDPRANIFKTFVHKLAHEKGREEEYQLYSAVERLAPQIIGEERKIYKGVSANVDFYSGFVYSMLDLPPELYHAHVCHGPRGRLERTPHRRAGQQR